MKVMSGDLEKGIWLICKDHFFYHGGMGKSRWIRFCDIETVTIKENIGSAIYIEIKLINDKLANAKLSLKHY
jgi:hypothetical protein